MAVNKLMIGMAMLLLAMAGCKMKESASSEPRIVNGKAIPDEQFPAVVPIYIMTNTGTVETKSLVCTGTFIAKRVIITAAHCVADPVSAGGVVKVPQIERILDEVPTKIIVHPEYKGLGFDPLHDIALMMFDKDLAPAVSPLSSRAAVVGDRVEIVGFGRSDPNDPESSGVKRWGANKLVSADDTLIFEGLAKSTSFDGQDTASARSDSGGPMFLDGALIGTTVGGAVTEDRKISQYTHLYAPAIKSFMLEAVSQGISFELPDTLKK